MAEQIEITQVRSGIGAQQAQRRTLRALGLRRLHQTVAKPDRPEIRGMLARVAHLVEVRYAGDGSVVDIQPGQQPKGAGHPAAGASVGDDEVVELRETEAEALSEPGSAALGDLVQNPPDLTSVDNPDRPKAASSPADEADSEDVAEDIAEDIAEDTTP